MLTSQQIAECTESKVQAVEAIWPAIVEEMKQRNIFTESFVVAVAATSGCESHFQVIHERGSRAYFNRYIGILGNRTAEMAYKYRGRGVVQLTGFSNYEKYGKQLGLELVNNPDLALLPENAAKIIVAYMHDHGCDVWAKRGHWLIVREKVNGRRRTAKNPDLKPNGWATFEKYVWNLLEEMYSERMVVT